MGALSFFNWYVSFWMFLEHGFWFGLPGWCLYQLSFFGCFSGWRCSCTRPQRRERRSWSPRGRKVWQKCERFVFSFFLFIDGSLCNENSWWPAHMFSFQGKPGLPGVQGPAGPKGRQVWMSIYCMIMLVYTILSGGLPLFVHHWENYILCVPPTGRSWSCRSWPSRTSSTIYISLKDMSGSLKKFYVDSWCSSVIHTTLSQLWSY